jgi:hypothetical protein
MRGTTAAVAAVAIALTMAVGAAASGLPDGRGYEFVSPGLNNSSVSPVKGRALPDGSAVQFIAVDPPLNSEAGSVANLTVARRGTGGWSTKSFTPPLLEASTGYLSFATAEISSALTQVVDLTDQPLAGPTPPSGQNLYYRHVDGSYSLITTAGAPLIPFVNFYSAPQVTWASDDFTHVYFQPTVGQPPINDPRAGENPGNTYEWTTDGDLRLIGILPGPGQTPAPNGAVIAVPSNGEVPPLDPVSADGEFVLWNEGQFLGHESAQSQLFLREHGQTTVEVSASQRSVEPDPNPPAIPTVVGITADGTRVLFTSRSELTDDAFTGRSGGVATDAGADLYSYDVASGALTDLTVDTNPADEVTGANVQRVLAATSDASFVYFIATGDLAAGATSGEQNLYVLHEGEIRFIASNPQLASENPFYVTPDGRHVAFVSAASLTGYDNVNPGSGEPEPEVYEYTFGGGLECASCHPDGTPPRGAARFASTSGGYLSGLTTYRPRSLSDDGSRLFFQSTDKILPAASNGLVNVYEYEGGEVHLISPGDTDSPAELIDASASGDDVFFATHGELVSTGEGSSSAVYDARVGAVTPNVVPPECSGEGCLGPPSPRPRLSVGGSTEVDAAGRVRAPGRKVVHGSRVRLRLVAPGPGGLRVSGRGLRPLHRSVATAGAVTVAVSLKRGADAARRRKGAFATRANVLFESSGGGPSRATVAIRFLATAKKGGK